MGSKPTFCSSRPSGVSIMPMPWKRLFCLDEAGTIYPKEPIGTTRAVARASTRIQSPGETFISSKRRRTGLVPLLGRTTGPEISSALQEVRVMVLRTLGHTMPHMPFPLLPIHSSNRNCDHPITCPASPPGVHRRHLRYPRPASPRSARGSRRRRPHPARGRRRRS